MAWQPIETAPKDGTRILLSDGETVDTACWGRIDMGGGKGWQRFVNVGGEWNDYGEFDNPTHWMRLPQPPQDSLTNLADAP
jgi:hypothetical protein